MNERGLYERYDELLELRDEARSAYGRHPFPHTVGPKAHVYLPAVRGNYAPYRTVRIGPVVVNDAPPIARVALDVFAGLGRKVRVLEIGPGRGTLATCLRTRFPDIIDAYYGLERDPSVNGDYERIDALDAIAGSIDVVIASEVLEHIPVDTFYSETLAPIAKRLAPDAIMIVSIPNPLSPGGIARDLTHIQNYPWYDLYAFLRLAFARVEIRRTFYLCSVARLFGLLPRIALTKMLELDWTEGLIAVARGARVD